MLKQSASVLIMENGKVLAVSRKNDPSDMGLIGGKKEPTETLEQCAIRECLEECGLLIYGLQEVFTAPISWGTYVNTTFIPAGYTGTIHTNEAGVVRWVEPQIIMAGTFAEYNTALFKHLGLIK